MSIDTKALCGIDRLEAYATENNVRLRLPEGGDAGLATCTYSYRLTEEQKRQAAIRLADLWNGADRLAALEAALRAVHTDLLLRGRTDIYGCVVVNVGASVWMQLCDALAGGAA